MAKWSVPNLWSISDMVEEYRVTANQEKNPHRSAVLIDEEFNEWTMASLDSETRFTEHELKELADLIYVAYGYANALGWDLDEAVWRVHKNNMDRMYQDDGTIQYREDGKVIKNPNTPKVNLKDLVE